MKAYFICLTLSLISGFSSQCQSTHDTCNCLKQYEGEWRYVNGDDTIFIYLRPHPAFRSNFIHCGYGLIGWHEYKKGNVTIESTYRFRSDSVVVVDSCSVFLYQKENCSPLFLDLNGYIIDRKSLHDAEIVTVAAISSGGLLWSQRQSEASIFINGKHAMTLPKEFLLVKQ